MGKSIKGIRLDSGDLTYLSKEARKMLDAAGLNDCKIVVSNSLDENIISELLGQGAQIDIFGVGERLITSKSEPVFGGVYKLAAVEEEGVFMPRIKVSENPEKITNPGYKEVWRLYDKSTKKALADKNILLEMDTSAKEYLLKKGTDLKYGARPLRRAIQRYLEDEISERILNGEILDGQNVKVDLVNNELKFEIN